MAFKSNHASIELTRLCQLTRSFSYKHANACKWVCFGTPPNRARSHVKVVSGPRLWCHIFLQSIFLQFSLPHHLQERLQNRFHHSIFIPSTLLRSLVKYTDSWTDMTSKEFLENRKWENRSCSEIIMLNWQWQRISDLIEQMYMLIPNNCCDIHSPWQPNVEKIFRSPGPSFGA